MTIWPPRDEWQDWQTQAWAAWMRGHSFRECVEIVGRRPEDVYRFLAEETDVRVRDHLHDRLRVGGYM